MDASQVGFWSVVALVLLALAFDFMNGFHDAANSIATVVSTGVLKPLQAVVFAGVCNVIAIFVFKLTVAATVGKGIVDPGVVDHIVVFGALAGAISWNIITWLRHSFQLLTRAHRGHRGGRDCQGRCQQAHRGGHLEDGGLHLGLPLAGIHPGLLAHGDRGVVVSARVAASRGQRLSSVAVGVGGVVFLGPWGQ